MISAFNTEPQNPLIPTNTNEVGGGRVGTVADEDGGRLTEPLGDREELVGRLANGAVGVVDEDDRVC